MNCPLLRQNGLWLKMSFHYLFMHLLLSIVHLFLVVCFMPIKGLDCTYGGRGSSCAEVSVLARLIHSYKQHLVLL